MPSPRRTWTNWKAIATASWKTPKGLANDWAWDEKETLENRSFKILQSSPSFVWREIKEAAYRQWLAEFGSALMKKPIVFWYDQFLAKPPQERAHLLAPGRGLLGPQSG